MINLLITYDVCPSTASPIQSHFQTRISVDLGCCSIFQCSKPCDTGSKTREVKCLDATLQPSLSCNAKRRPQERRACNKHSCDDPGLGSRQHRRTNDYDSGRPRRLPAPRRLLESTSPNTTYASYHGDGARQPLALQLSAPAEISLQQDFRSKTRTAV